MSAQPSTGRFSSTSRPADGYASSPAFDPDHPVRAAVEAGYVAAQQLVYGELISLDDALASVHRRRDLV